MDRELKTIILSNKIEVKIVSFLTWSEKEKITNSIFQDTNISDLQSPKINGSMMFEYKKTAFKECIKEIKDADKIVVFNDEFINSLSLEDGDLLWNEIEIVVSPKKK
jgi:hypothetical protein